jgi:hypothetical protein
MSEWVEAPEEVVNIAETLIQEHHPDLASADIAFAMKSEKKFKLKSHQIWAQASKIPAKLSAFVNYDFLIWIQWEIWEKLSDVQKQALIDHELCHCTIDETPKIIPHEIEEFSVVIERFGLWRTSLRTMGKAAKDYIQNDLGYLEQKIELSTPGGKVVSLTGEQLDKLAEKIPA